MIATEYCKKVFDGTHDSPKPVENGRLLITSKHIANRNLDISSAYLISEEDFENVNKRSQVHQWDILFSMIGTVGNVYIETSEKIDYAIKNMGVFSCQNKEKAYWLYYYLQSPLVQAKIDALMAGAVQKFVPLGFLRDLDIPEYTENSKKVVQVLSALDDKIALNKKMNQKLETMAKRLYDYWFVQYDFPDKNGHPYKTTGGPMTYNPTLKRGIPEGWEVKQICDITKIFNGSTPSTTEEGNYGGEIVWITPKDLSDQNCKFVYQGARNITQAGYDSCSTTMVPKGTVVMSSRAPIGLLSIAQCDLCTNQGFKNMVPNDMTDSKYLYYTIQQHIPQIQNLGTGTTFKEVSKDELGRFAILYPPKKLIVAFEEKVAPIFDVQFNKVKEISRLTTLRDKLLPLLMNGQVVVG